MSGRLMTRNGRATLLGSAALLALTLLGAPSVVAGGGPYDNDIPWSTPQSNESASDSPQLKSTDGTIPVVADVSARGATAIEAPVDLSQPRLELQGASFAGIGDEEDVAKLQDDGLSPLVVEVAEGRQATLEATNDGMQVSGEFVAVPSDGAPLEFKPGLAGDLRTAYLVFGEVDENGRVQSIDRFAAIPLWGHEGVDLRAIDAAAASVPWMVGLDALVVLSSVTFDLEQGTTVLSIDGSAQFEVGNLAGGVRVNTRGL